MTVSHPETGEHLPAVVGKEGDSFTVVKRRRPPAIAREEGTWAQVPVAQLALVAEANLSVLAMRLWLLLLSRLRLGEGNVVKLSAGNAAKELQVPDQRSRVRKALRDLATADLLVPVPQDGNSTASYLLNPAVAWVGDRDERAQAFALFADLKFRELLVRHGAAFIDPVTGELLDEDGKSVNAQSGDAALSLGPGERDSGGWVDVPLPGMVPSSATRAVA